MARRGHGDLARRRQIIAAPTSSATRASQLERMLRKGLKQCPFCPVPFVGPLKDRSDDFRITDHADLAS
jgi:hypothetical protein